MNTLETHVLELIGEDVDSPDVFTDDASGMAQIRDSLNDAIQEISMIVGGYEDTYSLPLTANGIFYRLDFSAGRGDFAWITGVWDVTNKRRLEQTDITRLNHHDPRWMTYTGNPTAYFPLGLDHMGVFPKPSADTEMLEVKAVLIPKRYTTDTDRIKLRDSYQWAAVHYAVGEYWASRGDAQSAIMHHNDYLKRLGIRTAYPIANERLYALNTNKEPWPKATE
jgi:hypothetical protein